MAAMCLFSFSKSFLTVSAASEIVTDTNRLSIKLIVIERLKPGTRFIYNSLVYCTLVD